MPKLPEELHDHFIDRDDFCYPEWQSIDAKINAYDVEQQKIDLWREATLTWLDRIQKKLGVQYVIYETKHFLFVANPTDKPMREYFAFVEKMRHVIHQTLSGLVWKGGRGKHVILLFDDAADYFRYIAPFYAEGDHPASGGVFLQGGGYRHIAIPYYPHSTLTTLAHEYTHNSLCHLPLPRWLDESVAMRFEHMLVSRPRLILSPDIVEKHHAQWTESTIQEFWQGKSWTMAGAEFGLSYEFAQILLKKIEEEIRPSRDSLLAFIGQAHRKDAGEAAAIMHLKISLGQLATDFLGAGNWGPQPLHWKKSDAIILSKQHNQ